MPQVTEQTSFASGAAKKYQRTPSSTSTQTKLLSPTSLNLSDGGAKFPRIDECAHFHYDAVDCGKIEMSLLNEAPESARINGTFDFERHDTIFWIRVKCKGKSWVIRRIPAQFQKLDELLHECVYDRKFTQLQPLKDIATREDKEALHDILKKYISLLSDLPEDQMSCAPVLHWFDMDNKGTKLVAALRETADINIPAVAAAHTVRRYTAQTSDELSLEVGDMVSIIDMSDANWWRGKCKLQVGAFPSQCVKRISDARQADEVHAVVSSPSSPTSPSPPNFNTSRTKPITKKHGKFMDFLRSFLVTRPTKSRLKQTGILKERVFGCDLGEYLHNCGDDVPVVVKDCTDFVEKYGIVDGVYRISGVASHVQNLRHEYDCERRPDLNRDPSGKGEQSICDPHSVAGLCKLYFRELPNPLLTYQLYNRFAAAIAAPEDDRLLKIHDVIQQLPPPHYRTLKHLAIHLQFMSRHEEKTSMHCRNLAIVWAPNLLRSRDLEAGLAAFTEARVQSVVTEFLIANADILFSDQLQNIQLSRGQKAPRPKSLMVLSGPKLISLEEAQARSKAGDGFSKPSSENFIGIEDQIQLRRSDISTSSELLPNDTKAVSSKPITIIPISSGGQSSMKRRQSEQKTGTSYQQHSRQPSTGSMSWKSKLGSFLKKGSNLQAESQEPKTEIKTPLRRSQSDDSMLSGQSSKLDDEKSVIKLNTNDTVNTTALRLAGSSKTPRPKGNIFLSNESLRHIDGYNVGKSDSIPTLSAHTNPSSHSPFSGLNSDFPGVMGDSGLGFNPLQYSPTFSSDSGIPDLPRTPKDQSFEDLTLVNNTSSQSNEVDEYYPRVTIGALDNIKPVKHTNGANQRTKHPQIPGGHGEALSVKGQDIPCASEKMVQGGGRIDGTSHSGNIQSNAAQPVKTAQNDSIAPVNDLSGSTSTRNCNTSNNQTVQESETAYGTPKSTADMNESFYWKSEEIDSLTEINELRPHHPDLGHAEPYHRTVPHEIQSQRNAQPVELPDISGYSVQYACNQEDFNGRTRRSIVATFVQDRPQDSRVRRPHSIRRSFDVPPTDIQQPSRRRLRVGNPYRQRSIYDITRRSQAYASWVSQHQKENFVKPADTWHGRSLSVGDELSPRERPIPAPRAMTRPAPPPRYNYGGSELGGIPFPSTTATASLGNELIFAHENHVNGRTILSPQIEHYTHNSKGLLCTLSQARPVYKSPVTVLSEQTIVARQPQPGMVSPSDNVCASTVLSWV